MEKRSGIYSIENIINGKLYIGSAKNLKQRLGEHLRRLRRNDHENQYLQSAWNKYGENNFIFNILFLYEKEYLLDIEQKVMDFYSQKLGWRNLYNLNPNTSSGFGRKHSLISIVKMSEKQRGENNGFYGKKHSPESIEKMRESRKGQIVWNKGKPWSDEMKEKIRLSKIGKELYGLDNPNFGKKLEGASSKYYGVSRIISRGKNIYWVVNISINGKSTYIGCYKTEPAAALAYNEYVISHGLPNPLNIIEESA